MFVECSRPNPDLASVWYRYSTKAHVVGALLLSVDPESHAVKDVVVDNTLLISSLVAPMLLARGLPWFTNAAVNAGIVKADHHRLCYVLGSGLQNVSCEGDASDEDDGDMEEDDTASDVSVESTESLVDFLVSVTQMTPEELAALPSEAIDVALTALRMITPAVTTMQRVDGQAPQGQVMQQQQKRTGCSGRDARFSCRDPDGMVFLIGKHVCHDTTTQYSTPTRR